MRQLGLPFDAVAREELVLAIYDHVKPIDFSTPLGVEVGFRDTLEVQVVDSDVISLEWKLGAETINLSDETTPGEFPLSQLAEQGVQPGNYLLTVTATDETDWIRLEAERPTELAFWVLDYFPGDFNGNRQTDVEDINRLTAEILADQPDLSFDLNGDALVDQQDREFWVTANQTFFGDLDLDGEVDFQDFLSFSRSFGNETAVGWEDGNLDGNVGVQFGDFLLLAKYFGQTSSVLSVPEPNLMQSLVLAMFVVSAVRRPRRMAS